jgi:uncharacterized protein (TIGR02145 family)
MRKQLTKIALTAALALAITFTLSCSDGGDDEDGNNDGNNNSGGVLATSCDMSGYRTVEIGGQVWMAENLNCDVGGSRCYDDNPANCTTYGRLYNWDAAKSACSNGWHLPSDDEWQTLLDFAGSEYSAGEKLKAVSMGGTDYYDFSALLGGCGYSSGSFYDVGFLGHWWSTSENGANYAYSRLMAYNSTTAFRYDYNKSHYYSVRCVQD